GHAGGLPHPDRTHDAGGLFPAPEGLALCPLEHPGRGPVLLPLAGGELVEDGNGSRDRVTSSEFWENIICHEGPTHKPQLRWQEPDRSGTGRLARNSFLRPGHGSRGVFSNIDRSSPSPMWDHARLSHQGKPCLEEPALADRWTRLRRRTSSEWADGTVLER